MESARPDVSIVMPVFNRAGMVRSAIDSALAVRDVAIELIIVDDASTDETWRVIHSVPDSRIRCIRLERNGGQSTARNAGIEIATGRYLKFLDSDDELLPAHLVLEVAAAERSAAPLVVSGWQESGDGGPQTFPAPVFTSIVDDVLAGLAVPTSAALYRRRGAPRWDPALRKLDDWGYFCRAALAAETIASVPGEAYVLRQHGGARATDAGMLINAREHHVILGKIESHLRQSNQLTDARKRRLAQYYYKELRVLCVNDRAAFERALAHIFDLDPRFTPRDEERQWYMQVLARAMGTRRAILLHTAIKKAVRRFR